MSLFSFQLRELGLEEREAREEGVIVDLSAMWGNAEVVTARRRRERRFILRVEKGGYGREKRGGGWDEEVKSCSFDVDGVQD